MKANTNPNYQSQKDSQARAEAARNSMSGTSSNDRSIGSIDDLANKQRNFLNRNTGQQATTVSPSFGTGSGTLTYNNSDPRGNSAGLGIRQTKQFYNADDGRTATPVTNDPRTGQQSSGVSEKDLMAFREAIGNSGPVIQQSQGATTINQSTFDQQEYDREYERLKTKYPGYGLSRSYQLGDGFEDFMNSVEYLQAIESIDRFKQDPNAIAPTAFYNSDTFGGRQFANSVEGRIMEEQYELYQQRQQQMSDPNNVTLTGVPMQDASSMAGQMIQGKTPASVQTQTQLTPEDSRQLISDDAGQVGAIENLNTTGATAEDAQEVGTKDANTYSASRVGYPVYSVAEDTETMQGEVDQEAQVQAQEGTASEGSMATGATVGADRVQQVQAGTMEVTDDQLVQAAGQDAQAATANIAESTGIPLAVAEQGTVNANELPTAAQIADDQMAQAEAVVSDGTLADDAVAVAARLEKFNVDNGTLAQAIQGDVNAQSTVQGQLEDLMASFDDGTPSWAAGALRVANAAMAARGLSGSSMAGAAIVQAAMESALPIAQADALAFREMNMANLDRQQQVALANAAAQQKVKLSNFDAEQQAALQNSQNAFNLQSQDLTAMQNTVIANAQIKASLQGKNLEAQQQTNIAIAARYAESAKMNLNNRQQTALQNNANAQGLDLANLNNRQQSYITNAQLEASLQGKVLDMEQQTAIANAARFADAANITFSAEQQASLHNSELMKTIGIAELNSEQAAILQNAATVASMDLANLNNRQQAAVQNAKAFLEMDMTNLNNAQQVEMFKQQKRIDALFSDQAAENAAKQFNATSENQTDQFFAKLAQDVRIFNAEQQNVINRFNAGEINDTNEFNKQMQNLREQFNANNKLVIEQANAKWFKDVATADTAAINFTNIKNAENALALTEDAFNNMYQERRDIMEHSWQSGENDLDRMTEMAITQMNNDTDLRAADKKIDAENARSVGSYVSDVIDGMYGTGSTEDITVDA